MNFAPETSPSAVDAYFTPRRFALFLAFTIAINFWQVLLGLETFFFRDYLSISFPYAQYNYDCFWRGEFPLWNPLNHCGVPYLAQWQTFVLYPGWWLCLPFPPSFSLGILALAHLFLAGMAMYFFAFRWSGSRLGACIAGILFVWNGVMQNTMIWPVMVATLAWAPIVMLVVERAWRLGGSHIVYAALAGAMQMLTGAPEQILFTWGLVTMLLILDVFREKSPKMVARFLMVVVLVTALTAAQVFPFLDLIVQSHRSANFATTEGALPGGMSWAMPAWGWANLLVPYFFNFPTPSGVYFQVGQYMLSSYYLGAATLALVFWCLCKNRTAHVYVFGGLFLGALVLSMGEHTPVYAAIRKIFPPIGFMRYPVKFMYLAVLIAPVLVASAVGQLLRTDAVHARKQLWQVLGVSAVFLLLIAGIVWFANQFPLYPGLSKLWLLVLKSGLSRGLLLVLGTGSLAGIALTSHRRTKLVLAVVAVVVCWIDLQTPTLPTPNPTVPRWAYDPDIVKLEPKPKIGQSRAFVTLETQMRFLGLQSPDPGKDVLQNRMVLLHQCNLIDGIPVVGGAHTLLLPASDAVASLLLITNVERRKPVADFLSVSQVSSPGTLEWNYRPGAMPMITTGQKPLFVDDRASLAGMASESFNPRKVVYLPQIVRETAKITNSTRAAILATNITSQKIDVSVEAPEGTWLVLAQSFHPNWRATMDGKPTKIWKANHGFQAIELPPGKHIVELVYKDNWFLVGAIISVFTAISCLVALVIFRRRAGAQSSTQPA